MDKNVTEKQHTFTWKISDFRFLCLKSYKFITSPVFTTKGLHQLSWYLKLYLSGDEDDSETDKIVCDLCRSENCEGPFEIYCEFKIEVIYAKNKNYFSDFTGVDKFLKGDFHGIDFYSNEKLPNSILSEDTLTIHCDLNIRARELALRSECVGLTKVDTDYCSFNWLVRYLNSNYMETKSFSCTGETQVIVNAHISVDDIIIRIQIIGSILPQRVMCRMTLLDLNGQGQDSKQDTHIFKKRESWKFPTFLKKSKLNSEKEKYIKDDSFTLKCEISVSNETVTNSIENKDEWDSKNLLATSGFDTISSLKADIMRMYTDKTQTDVVLIVDKKLFPAHKFILSARSPVFLAMFNQDMVETQSGQVEIPDIEAKTLDLLLKFMYTDSVNEMDGKSATKLLLAANKYQVLTLKEKCSVFLKSFITDSSVCDALVVADLIGEKTLRDAAVCFIKKRSKNILKSNDWKQLVEKNLTLATDVIWEISTLMTEDNE